MIQKNQNITPAESALITRPMLVDVAALAHESLLVEVGGVLEPGKMFVNPGHSAEELIEFASFLLEPDDTE